MKKHHTASLLALALLLAACGSPGAITTVPPIPTNPAALVLAVRYEGGLLGGVFLPGELPAYALYGDGRLITQGPQIEIYPGPLLPNLQAARLTAEQVAEVVAKARAAGLATAAGERLEGSDAVMDAPDTVFIFGSGQTEHRLSAYALGFNEESGRRRLLMDLLALLDSAALQSSTPYQSERLLVNALPSPPPDEPLAQVKEWPLEAPLPLDNQLQDGWTCQVFGDESGATLLAAFGNAHALTFWESGGATYQVIARPAYPDETACA